MNLTLFDILNRCSVISTRCVSSAKDGATDLVLCVYKGNVRKNATQPCSPLTPLHIKRAMLVHRKTKSQGVNMTTSWWLVVLLVAAVLAEDATTTPPKPDDEHKVRKPSCPLNARRQGQFPQHLYTLFG